MDCQKKKALHFWAQVCANLSNRGVKDVFIVCCDGFKGLLEAVEVTWPNSMVQTCIVHLICVANRWVAYGDRWGVSAALKKVLHRCRRIHSLGCCRRF
ncbi:transposase [Corynebacterium belfantii]|nr:transposase [Corynebacterium belfantii]